MIPFPIPWRAIGYAGLAVGAFAWGWLWRGGLCDKAAQRLVIAQQTVVAQQQAKNTAELAHQLQVNQAIGAENAKLQADNNLANLRMRGLLRAFAQHGAHALPGPAPSAGGVAVTGDEPGCTQSLGDFIERVADLSSAARADATELTLLQKWAGANGLMH